MAAHIVAHFQQPGRIAAMRAAARARAVDYDGIAIMDEYLQNLGLPAPARPLQQRSVA
jgi:hypothetical protein